MPTIDDFAALALRVATVVRAEPNTGARDPAIALWLELAGGAVVQSSAKITDHYTPESVLGRQVVVVTGFDPIRVGGFRSDVLVLGALGDTGVVLLTPDDPVPPGTAVA